ncbi:MAG TPA: cation:proton antiporter [Sedimentisphaerales bacterium]|nr:cation:proton antiporter [Sedimentisphaerales bacterium]
MNVQEEGLNIILLIGIAVFGGTVGARIFQKLKIPRIVGYVVIGILLGPVFNVISQKAVQDLQAFDIFALGVIGFLVGGELKKEIFLKFGRQVPLILLLEGVTAFFLVGILSFLVMWHFSDWHTALAVAVVFGAICSATDPASTIAVLWEYKARGPLTSMLTAIVTLDDALALVLYAISIGVAGVITGHQESGFSKALLDSFYEMSGSFLVGAAAGAALSWIIKRLEDTEILMAFTAGSILLFIGTAVHMHLDVILTSMAAGVTLINIESRKTSSTFQLMHRFATPIYVLFFVMVGARLRFQHVDKMILALVAAYVIGSTVGKTLGSHWGARISGAVKTVRNYLGFCLYPQGGIAVGLLIMASQKFDTRISEIMLLVVIMGAFVLQIIGPIGVKIGAGRAHELGLNVTEEDLIKTYKVGQVMDTQMPVISAGMSLREVITVFSNTDRFYYSVVDIHGVLIGVVTLDGIRNTFATQELNDWLVAMDIMEPVVVRVSPDISLADALEKMKEFEVEYIPVIASAQDGRLVGVLNGRAVHRKLSAQVLARQREADAMFEVSPV